jgi:CheY-like chemotaxis protein
MASSVMRKPVDIVVVDDDKVDVELIRRLFKKANLDNHLHHASCGIEALDMLRGENSKDKITQPYIMLIDINMPRMNGIELLQELRKDNMLKRTIVFILSTSRREEEKSAFYDLNIAGYFLKDNLGQLAEMLGSYCKVNEFCED